jgi:hypothetical protein
MRAVGDARVKIGKVQYIDFAKGFAGIHERFLVKRRSLGHEAEVRLIIQEFESTGDVGKDIPVNLESLIAAVVPSPFAPGGLPECWTLRSGDMVLPSLFARQRSSQSRSSEPSAMPASRPERRLQ